MAERDRTSREVALSRGVVHYHDLGDGKPLILLHGGGPGASGWSNYGRNAAALAAKFRLLIVDFPGFGLSAPISLADGAFTTYAGVVSEFLDALDIGKASLIGNSLGGGTALKFALDRPDKVDRLVLMGAAGGRSWMTPVPSEGLKHLFGYYRGGGPSPEKLKAFLEAMVYDSTGLTEALLKERFEASTAPRVMADPPFGKDPIPPIEDLWRENLGRLPHPTLLIWGRDDRTIPLDASLSYLAQIPNVELHVFGKCGHWAQWERPHEFNRLVVEFLTRENS